MKALTLIIALLGHHTHSTAPELGEAIDTVCAGDRDCILDAVATCYMETRCRVGICREGGSDCGPFQQIARYADHPALVGMSNGGRMAVLRDDVQVATEQWKIKRDKYKARHGDRWPYRYNGSPRAEQYLEHWERVRARAEGLQ